MKTEHHLTEKHHAILFALLARQEIAQFGQEAGEAAIREAVRQYGEQRGRRMAQRAVRDHQLLNLSTFLCYGEWRSLTGEGKSEMQTHGEDLINRVKVCPWNNAWLDTDLQPYGRLYCLEIDAALARGFNPGVSLEVRRTLSNGGEVCEFIFHQAVQSSVQPPAERTVRSWDYHCAHLYHTCREVLKSRFGETGEEVAERAFSEFVEKYANTALEEIQRYAAVDFETI
jgi:hypothetical protein